LGNPREATTRQIDDKEIKLFRSDSKDNTGKFKTKAYFNKSMMNEEGFK